MISAMSSMKYPTDNPRAALDTCVCRFSGGSFQGCSLSTQTSLHPCRLGLTNTNSSRVCTSNALHCPQQRATSLTSDMDDLSEKVSDHRIKYAARADIANACRVDDTLHIGQQQFSNNTALGQHHVLHMPLPTGCPNQFYPEGPKSCMF